MDNIPTYQDISSSFEQEIILGDRLMIITLFWNSRSEAWYMDIEDNETGDSVSGVKLIPDWPVLRQYRAYIPNFEGDIMAIVTDTDVDERITYDNLNDGYELNYITAEELEQWEDYNGVG